MSRAVKGKQGARVAWIGAAFLLWGSAAEAWAQTLPYQVGSEIAISALEDVEEAEPDIAWNGKEFFVVWQSEKSGTMDLYGTRMTEEGKVLDPEGTPLFAAQGSQTSPKVVWGGDLYLLVWQDVREDQVSHLYGARITREGKVLDPGGFPISVVPQKEEGLSVHWDGKQFWVTWERVQSFVYSVIYASRIGPDGRVLDPGGIRISRSEGQDYYASISGDREGRVFVVWGTKKDKETDVWGVRLDREGKILDPKGILIASGPQDQFYPSLAWNGKEYLAAWVEERKGAEEGPLVFGCRIDREGKRVEGPVSLSFLPVAHSRPFVYAEGAQFQVLWEEERKKTLIDSYGVRLGPTLDKETRQRVEISAYFGRQLAPRAAFSGRRTLVVWMDYRKGVPFHGDILGQLIEFPLAVEKKTEEERNGPFIIHQIAAHPGDSRILLAATSHYGILKSADGGKSWSLTNRGLESFTHTQVVFHPVNPEIVYAGGWGGGVSISRDGGVTWEARNRGLGNTTINGLILDPRNPETLYVATSSGVWRSFDGGNSWESWSEGLPVKDEEEYTDLIGLSSGDRFLLGGMDGVYQRRKEEGRWEKVTGESIRSVTSLHEGANGTLYAGTLREGFWKSADLGKSWVAAVPSSHPLSRAWITGMVSAGREEVYVATTEGLWRMAEAGETWTDLRSSFPGDPDIRSLTPDPSASSRLYAGTFEGRILSSLDGGASWREGEGIPRLTKREVLAYLPSLAKPEGKKPPLPVPDEFAKCNQCHGWTDPWLDTRGDKSYWRMPANERDWGPTVARMGPKAQLTAGESARILKFLTEYTARSPLLLGGEGRGEGEARILTSRACGACHGLRIAGECIAGDCSDPQRVKEAEARPWGLIVDWMRELGAALTDPEAQEIVSHLRILSPEKASPLAWEKAITFGEGAWNIVALTEWKGMLFAGMEGTGKIYRSGDGVQWETVADTGANRVYGLVPFKGALYGGTSDPAPEVWSTADGKVWSKAAALPEKEQGIISLGVFGDRLYAGTETGRVYRSSDGVRWETAGMPRLSGDAVNWVRFLVPFKGQLYAGTEHGGIFRSPDGIRWEEVGRALKESGEGVHLRGVCLFQGGLYVGSISDGKIWRTEDGVRWTPAFDANPGSGRGYAASMTVFMDLLYASVNGRVYRTSNGADWEEVGYLSPYTVEAMTPFKGALYAGTLLIGMTRLYRTSPDGPGANGEMLLVRQIVGDAGNPRTLYAATFNQGVLKSKDGGATWTPVNQGIRNDLISSVAFDPSNPETLYAATWGGGIYKSLDGGGSWEEANGGLGNTAVWGVAIHPDIPTTLYAGTSTGIYRSLDGGISWLPFNRDLEGEGEEMEDGVFLFLPSSASADLIFGNFQGGNRADLSTGLWSKMEGLSGEAVTAMAYDSREGAFYVGTGGNGLLRSGDRGKTFRRLQGTERLWVEDILFDPLSPAEILLATRSGIYRSEDGGATWEASREAEIGNLWVTSLYRVSGKSPKGATLIAGTQDQGLWRKTAEGKDWEAVRDLAFPWREAWGEGPPSAEIAGSAKRIPNPPASFAKCNECHGWTDPRLNSHSPTPWRVALSGRDWTATVKRMSGRAQLSRQEEGEIIRYLNSISSPAAAQGGGIFRNQPVRFKLRRES